MDNEARNSSKTPNPAFPVCCLSFMASCWIAFGIFFLFSGIYLVIYVTNKPELGKLCILMSLVPIIIGCIMFYCVRIECCEKPFFPKYRINEVQVPQQPNISVHIHQQPENQVSYNFTWIACELREIPIFRYHSYYGTIYNSFPGQHNSNFTVSEPFQLIRTKFQPKPEKSSSANVMFTFRTKSINFYSTASQSKCKSSLKFNTQNKCFIS